MFPSYILWAVCATILVGTASSCRHPWLLEKPVALFVFGDSTFDAGNNNYITTTLRANFWPYGETFFVTPTGRASDGRTIPDFISEYAKLPLIPPYLQPYLSNYDYGVNFASIGAGALVETNRGLVINLKTQLIYFKNVEKQLRRKLGGEEARTLLSRAVYLLEIGANDYFDPSLKNSSFFESQNVQKEYVGMVIGNLTNAIQEIYKLGGRKFGFLNMPPLGCVPSVKANEPIKTDCCVEEFTEIAKLHNRVLSEAFQNLESRLAGFKYSLLDVFTSFRHRLEEPSKYGFKEVDMACCGSGPYRGFPSCGSVTEAFELCENPSDFLYFDPSHPTEKAYEQMAKLLWSGNSDITGPYNFKSLFELDNKCRLHSLISN